MKNLLYPLCFLTLPIVSWAQQIADYPLLASFFCCSEELMELGESNDIAMKCIVPNQWYTFELREEDHKSLVESKLGEAIPQGEAIHVNPPVNFGYDQENELTTYFFKNGSLLILISQPFEDPFNPDYYYSCTLMLRSITSPVEPLYVKRKKGFRSRNKKHHRL